MLRKNVASQYVYFTLVKASDGTALTGSTAAGLVTLDGGTQASVTGSFTNLGNGQYRFNASQADTNGNYVGYLFTASTAVPVSANFITTGGDFSDGVRFGITALPNAAAAAAGGLPTFGTSSGQITASSGQVTVATNNDKTGYTASTVSDKTGYSLSQSFPTNFSALAVTAGGAVTTGTVSDKTGYALTSAYDLAKTAAQVGSAMTLDLTQAVPTSNTAQTTGDALNAARAQGFGKWVVSGTTLTLYANDGTTVVRTFTLDSATAPTSRS